MAITDIEQCGAEGSREHEEAISKVSLPSLAVERSLLPRELALENGFGSR